jgi:hypothetical protein
LIAYTWMEWLGRLGKYGKIKQDEEIDNREHFVHSVVQSQNDCGQLKFLAVEVLDIAEISLTGRK